MNIYGIIHCDLNPWGDHSVIVVYVFHHSYIISKFSTTFIDVSNYKCNNYIHFICCYRIYSRYFPWLIALSSISYFFIDLDWYSNTHKLRHFHSEYNLDMYYIFLITGIIFIY